VTLVRPLLLLLLLPLFLLRRRGAHRPPVALPGPSEPTLRVRLVPLPRHLATLAAALALLAAAGPTELAAYRPDRRMARDIVLALDTSESMRAVDFAPGGRPASRMAAARRFAAEFIRRREGDRIGIVAFGGRAVTQCPLTFDREIAVRLLDYVEPEMLGKRTALGDGLGLATVRLNGGGACVLVSDGQNTAGTLSPERAAEAAAEKGVRVYAIAVGSEGPVPVPARMPSGRTRTVMKDYQLDEATLRQVAEATGGRYFRADDADALRKVFGEIDEMERTPKETVRPARAGAWVTGLTVVAAVCLLVVLVLSATVLRTAPVLK
jgi:Ca-activated chloride channel family protein